MNFVRELRERAGRAQSLLAKLSGVSTRTISEYESGRGSPTVRTLGRMAEAVGMDVVVMVVPSEEEPAPPDPDTTGRLARRRRHEPRS
ncbi:MAG: hypothetical protein BMS9Abin17_0861 [Acidimicrobiia bacterium]|nr:MAG: hypothetical protein BMS9Abin17_0861 [Acidimicrobiia bacterium]